MEFVGLGNVVGVGKQIDWTVLNSNRRDCLAFIVLGLPIRFDLILRFEQFVLRFGVWHENLEDDGNRSGLIDFFIYRKLGLSNHHRDHHLCIVCVAVKTLLRFIIVGWFNFGGGP